MTAAIVVRKVNPDKDMFIVISYSHGFTTGFPVSKSEGRAVMAVWSAHKEASKRWFSRPKPLIIHGDDWVADTATIVCIRMVSGAGFDLSSDSGSSEAELKYKTEMMDLSRQMAREQLRRMRKQNLDEPWQRPDDSDLDDPDMN